MIKKIGLYVIVILVLSAFVFAEQVAIGVEGTVTKDGNPYSGPITLNVDGSLGTTNTFTDNGKFSVLVGGQTTLSLICGTQHTLNIYISQATPVLVGGYTFIACYGTQGNFNVPTNLNVGGNFALAGTLSLNGNSAFLTQKDNGAFGDTLHINPWGSPTTNGAGIPDTGYDSIMFNANGPAQIIMNGGLSVNGGFKFKKTYQTFYVGDDTPRDIGQWDICVLSFEYIAGVDDGPNDWGNCMLNTEGLGWENVGDFGPIIFSHDNKPRWALRSRSNEKVDEVRCQATCMNFS
jgi:hypothetical protein